MATAYAGNIAGQLTDVGSSGIPDFTRAGWTQAASTVNGMTPTNNAASPNIGDDITPATSPATPMGNQAAVDFSNVINPYSATGFIDPNTRGTYADLLGQASPLLGTWNSAYQTAQGLPGQVSDWSKGISDNSALSQFINSAGGLMNNWNSAMQSAQGLPDRIDQWAADAKSNVGINRDDVITALTTAANDRAARGIMGGTEANNLRANLLAQLAKDAQDRTGAIDQAALGYKTQAGLAVPSAAGQGLDFLNSLIGLDQSSGQNALQLMTSAATTAPQMSSQGLDFLNSLIGQGRESVQEDPAAWGNIISGLIQAGFTG